MDCIQVNYRIFYITTEFRNEKNIYLLVWEKRTHTPTPPPPQKKKKNNNDNNN